MEIINGNPINWVVAIKDIQQGQELFLDYGKDYFKNLECLCKGENCVEIEKKERNERKKKEKERRRLEELEEERWMNFKRILRE